MTYLVTNEQHYCDDSHSSPEQWGEWSESWSFYPPTRAYVNPDPRGSGFAYAGPELNVGDTLYFVYAVWSTGDSFGHSERGNFDFLVANKDEDTAWRNLEKIKNANSGMATVELDNGKTSEIYCGSWDGYFESLDTLDVAKVIVVEPNSFD